MSMTVNDVQARLAMIGDMTNRLIADMADMTDCYPDDEPILRVAVRNMAHRIAVAQEMARDARRASTAQQQKGGCNE